MRVIFIGILLLITDIAIAQVEKHELSLDKGQQVFKFKKGRDKPIRLKKDIDVAVTYLGSLHSEFEWRGKRCKVVGDYMLTKTFGDFKRIYVRIVSPPHIRHRMGIRLRTQVEKLEYDETIVTIWRKGRKVTYVSYYTCI